MFNQNSDGSMLANRQMHSVHQFFWGLRLPTALAKQASGALSVTIFCTRTVLNSNFNLVNKRVQNDFHYYR